MLELLHTSEALVKQFKFKMKMHDLGFDTDSKNYERFQAKFETTDGKNTVRVNRINDLIMALEHDLPLDSEQEEAELKKSRKFDRDQNQLKSPEKN